MTDAILEQVALARSQPGAYDPTCEECGHPASKHAIVREPVIGDTGWEGENYRVECRARADELVDAALGGLAWAACECRVFRMPQ